MRTSIFSQFTDNFRASRASTRGFTLIEMIVVIGITAIMSSILVGYSREGNRQLILTNTEAKLISLANRAKFLSIETFFENTGAGSDGRIVCAYGVKVDRSAREIFIFQDRASVCPANNEYDSGVDIRLNSELDSIRLDPASVSMTDATNLNTVMFIPPDPDIIINNNTSNQSASVVIQLVGSSKSFKMSINKAGQIKTE